MNILQVVIGLILALFLPGFLIALIFFKELEALEKVGLAFVFSIMIDIIVGLFLGYNEYMKNLTGGIIARNVWIYLSLITLILLIVYYLKERKMINKWFKKKVLSFN